MSTSGIQPDLIIALSQGRVRINLSENIATGRSAWQMSFNIDNMFLGDQISQSLDKALVENPALMDAFPSVEVVIIDRPNIFVSRHYAADEKLVEIASRYLRLRKGDILVSDQSENDALICYTFPIATMKMLKEYYADLGCYHLSTILWNHFITEQKRPGKEESRLYLNLIEDTLIVMSEKNNKLVFSKNFMIRDKGDLFYYSIACSRMLKASENWLVLLGDEADRFEMPGDSILKIDERLRLPSLDVLMAQYKVCVS